MNKKKAEQPPKEVSLSIVEPRGSTLWTLSWVQVLFSTKIIGEITLCYPNLSQSVVMVIKQSNSFFCASLSTSAER